MSETQDKIVQDIVKKAKVAKVTNVSELYDWKTKQIPFNYEKANKSFESDQYTRNVMDSEK